MRISDWSSDVCSSDLNIEGTYNVFEAARRKKVRRVVFASSNHTVGFHRTDHAIDINADIRPDTLYGVSKVYGEALGRMVADKYGLRSEEHTSELQSLMRISYAVFCLKKKNRAKTQTT